MIIALSIALVVVLNTVAEVQTIIIEYLVKECLIDHYIFQFDVSVHDVERMEVFDSFDQLRPYLPDLPQIESIGGLVLEVLE